MNSINHTKPRSYTMDAWILLWMSFGTYAVFSSLGSRLSILGATAAGQLLFLLLPSLLFAKWKCGSIVEGLRLRPVTGGIMWRVALLALTFIGVGDLLQEATQPVMARYFPGLFSTLEKLSEILTPKSAAGLAGNLLIVGLIAPVCEEVLFRGTFQGTLERRGPIRAILTSALVFAFVHLNPISFLPIILVGIALGYVTWRTQSLWPAILWHIVNNSAAMLARYFGDKSSTLPTWLNVMLSVAFIGVAWEFFHHIRRVTPAAPAALASAPALLGGWASRVTKAGGLTALLLLVVGLTCFGRASLASDFLAPEYTRGDIVVYTRGPAFQPAGLKERDIVIYRRTTGGTLYTRILAIDGEKVNVIGPEDDKGERLEIVILRKDIIGKVIWKFDPGEEIKSLQLMSQSKDTREPGKTEPHSPAPGTDK